MAAMSRKGTGRHVRAGRPATLDHGNVRLGAVAGESGRL
jgi:hypothetical protein